MDVEYQNSILVGLFRQHVSSKYPGSKHWDPNKITPSTDGIGVKIDIPGADRAYHDIDIYPKNGQWLTIPLLPWLVGLSARDQTDLFRPWRRGGGERANVLAKKTASGNLVFFYALSKHVHQKQDSSLLPDDEAIANAFFEAYEERFVESLRQQLS